MAAGMNAPRGGQHAARGGEAPQGGGIIYRKRWGGPYGVGGDPDLYFVVRGQHYEVELKRPGGKPTKLQQVRLHEWEGAGARCVLCSSVADFRLFLDGLNT
jgi:hypothetical protein